MRNAFIVSFLANVVLSLASLVILPDRVAIHFGLGGAPDGWASNLTSMLLVIFLAYTVYWVVALMRAFRIPKAPGGRSDDI